MADADLKDPDIYAVWTRDTIRYSDLDPNGHVNNGAINAYFEDGRTRYREEHLAHLADDVLRGFVVARFSVDYFAALYFPGTVDVATAVIRIGRSSYTLGQGVFHDGRCAASAEVVTVRFDHSAGRSVPIEDEVREALERAAPKRA